MVTGIEKAGEKHKRLLTLLRKENRDEETPAFMLDRSL